MSREAWQRWGEDDERGALNHIGSVQVQGAAALVRSGRVLSLAQTLSPRTPVPRHRAGIQHFMGRDGGDYAAGARRPGGFQFAEDTVVLPLHFGTTSMRYAMPGMTMRYTTVFRVAAHAARAGPRAAASTRWDQWSVAACCWMLLV